MTANVLPFSRPFLACRLVQEGDDLTHDHIEVHCKSQHCLTCGTTHRWSEVYETHTKGKSRTLSPCRTPGMIPIHYFIVPVEIPQEPVLACHECIGSHKTITDHESRQRWSETLKRKALEDAKNSEGPTTASGKPIVTVDML